MKKYSTTIWPLTLVLVLCIIGFAFFGSMGAEEPKRVLIGVGIFASVPVLIVILFGWLTYLKLYDNKIEYVEWLFYRRKTEVSNITHITIEGGYYVLQSIIKMMFVYYTDKKGRERFLHISLSLYDTETLQQLLKDLLAINSNIKLDKATERILRTGK